MNLPAIFTFNAVVALIFGVVFVFIPGQTAELYDLTLSEGGILIGRLFGAALIVFAVLTWRVRHAQPSAERHAIVLSLFIGDVIGFVASLLAQLAGVSNALGWSTVAIYLILALAFGYQLFVAGESPT